MILDQIQSIYLDELINLHNRLQINYNNMETTLSNLLKDGFVEKKTINLKRSDISFKTEKSFVEDIQIIKKNILNYFISIYEILIELNDNIFFDRIEQLKKDYKKIIDKEVDILDLNTFKNRLTDYSIDLTKINYGSLYIYYHKF